MPHYFEIRPYLGVAAADVTAGLQNAPNFYFYYPTDCTGEPLCTNLKGCQCAVQNASTMARTSDSLSIMIQIVELIWNDMKWWLANLVVDELFGKCQKMSDEICVVSWQKIIIQNNRLPPSFSTRAEPFITRAVRALLFFSPVKPFGAKIWNLVLIRPKISCLKLTIDWVWRLWWFLLSWRIHDDYHSVP